jgi:hypothetical protein
MKTSSRKTREQMLFVSESVALYRGSAKTPDKKYLAQEQYKLQLATRKNQDNGYRTSNIHRKKRHNCQLTLRAFVLYRGSEKKKDSQDRNYATRNKNKLEPATRKNQSNDHSFDFTSKKRHNSMVYRSICYVGQLRPHHPHLTHHPDSTTTAKRDGLAGNRTPDHSHAKGVLYH